MGKATKRAFALLICLLLFLSAENAVWATGDAPNVSVGDIITFGNYHGATEWQVLAVESDRIFVISRQCLDCRPYNDTSAAVTWETCSLRKWLNSEFIGEAFSAEEQKRILMTDVINSRIGTYGSDGNDTKDRIYLLNVEESTTYFPTESARKATPTDFALEQGSTSKGGICFWWLRSRGEIRNKAAYVYTNGKRGYLYVSNSHCSVRPVMWLSLEEGVSVVTTEDGDSVLVGSSGQSSGWILDPERFRELLDRLLHAATD